MDQTYAWAWVGVAELKRGNSERSLYCVREFARLESTPFAHATVVWALMAEGRIDEAEALGESLEAANRDEYVMPVALAMSRFSNARS